MNQSPYYPTDKACWTLCWTLCCTAAPASIYTLATFHPSHIMGGPCDARAELADGRR
jgi:hypothetical protein